MLSFPDHRRTGRARWIGLGAALILLLVFGRSICSLIIDYLWWREMGQVSTWFRASAYLYATNVAEWVIAVVAMVIAAASMNGWVVARFAAGSGVVSTWTDPVFNHPLGFYFFELPFYT